MTIEDFVQLSSLDAKHVALEQAIFIGKRIGRTRANICFIWCYQLEDFYVEKVKIWGGQYSFNAFSDLALLEPYLDDIVVNWQELTE